MTVIESRSSASDGRLNSQIRHDKEKSVSILLNSRRYSLRIVLPVGLAALHVKKNMLRCQIVLIRLTYAQRKLRHLAAEE